MPTVNMISKDPASSAHYKMNMINKDPGVTMNMVSKEYCSVSKDA